MSISPNSQMTMRVGNKSFPVLPKFQGQAAYYDANQDGKVTLTEITDTLTNLPKGMTFHKQNYAVGLRQQMLGQQSPHVQDYPTSKEINQQIKALAAEHSDKAEVVTVGQSTDGRPVNALRISNDIKQASTEDKPSVIVTGNVHAREWTTNGAVTAAAEKILEGAADQALEELELWFIPDANPDGYTHSRNVDPMWRKNTWRDDSGEIKGVDLNRNFSHNYRLEGDTTASTTDDIGASDDTDNLTFRGTGPLSEPEARNIHNLLAQENNAVGLLDVHGFGRMLLVSDGKYDVPREKYDDIAKEMNSAMKHVDYTVMTDEGLYPTTGGLSTYADSLGMVGITMEIGTSFHPTPKESVSTIERASDGIVEFVEQMAELK